MPQLYKSQLQSKYKQYLPYKNKQGINIERVVFYNINLSNIGKIGSKTKNFITSYTLNQFLNIREQNIKYLVTYNTNNNLYVNYSKDFHFRERLLEDIEIVKHAHNQIILNDYQYNTINSLTATNLIVKELQVHREHSVSPITIKNCISLKDETNAIIENSIVIKFKDEVFNFI